MHPNPDFSSSDRLLYFFVIPCFIKHKRSYNHNRKAPPFRAESLTFSGFYIAANLIKAGLYKKNFNRFFIFFEVAIFTLFDLGYNSIFTLFILD